MKPSAYRKKIQADLKRAATGLERALATFRDTSKSATSRAQALSRIGQLQESSDLKQARDLAADKQASSGLRIAALRHLGPLLGKDKKALSQVIGSLGDQQEPVEVRTASLALLKDTTFVVLDLGAARPKYVSALRAAARADDELLRVRALGVLVREGDGPTFNALQKGLEKPASALVPPEKALQLLRYDTKRDVSKLLKELASSSPEAEVRCQALRGLSADESARPLLLKVMKAKRESLQARLIAMSALQSQDPRTFAKAAKRMLGDNEETEEVREACLVAAATSEEETERAQFRADAERLVSHGSTRIKKAAASYLDKLPSRESRRS